MPSKRLAFTLIELLVVVAIIALLIAILLPTLSEAREQGKRAVCSSNLHQLGIAMQHYLSDNADWFPGSPGAESNFEWRDENGEELRNDDGTIAILDPVWCYGGQAGTGTRYDSSHRCADADLRPFNKYLPAEYYECPSDRGQPDMTEETMHADRGTSYSLNGYNGNGYAEIYHEPYQWLGIVNRRTIEYTNSKCVIAGEAVIDEYFTWPGDFVQDGQGYGIRWHNKKKPMANVVFLDGSAKYSLMTGSVKPRETGMYNLYWWEGRDYSFCPTAWQERRGDFWKKLQ